VSLGAAVDHVSRWRPGAAGDSDDELPGFGEGVPGVAHQSRLLLFIAIGVVYIVLGML
jgi:hypothetical protein